MIFYEHLSISITQKTYTRYLMKKFKNRYLKELAAVSSVLVCSRLSEPPYFLLMF